MPSTAVRVDPLACPLSMLQVQRLTRELGERRPASSEAEHLRGQLQAARDTAAAAEARSEGLRAELATAQAAAAAPTPLVQPQVRLHGFRRMSRARSGVELGTLGAG